MRLLARFLFSFFVIYLLSIILFATPAHAQYTNPYATPNTDPNIPNNLHTYTQNLVLEVLSAFTCQLIGQDPLTQNHMCLGFNPSTGKIGYVSSTGGVIGFVGNMIASLYTPPIDTPAYIHYVASNFGLTKHAYAASTDGSLSNCSANGCGFDKLTPLLGLWTTFRNIAYAGFVIIFIAIGFAIMLRVKIDPRTVMTIENQIPKIIIGLLLVTFSYAIAGFLIDTMYATTYLTINIITNSGAVDKPTVGKIQNAETNDLFGGNPLGFANDVLNGGILGITAGSAGSVGGLIRSMLTPGNLRSNGITPVTATDCENSQGFLGFFGTAFCNLGNNIGDIVAGAIGYIISWGVTVLALLVILIAILVALFRLWLSLILVYVNILLEIVLAPFFIIVGVFPGSKIGFGSWVKSMIGNLLAFPVTVAMFLLADVFMNSFATQANNIFVPPLIGNPQPGGGGQSPLAYIIALGMILLTPNVVGMTRGLVGAGDNKALGGIFAGIGVGGKATGSIFKQTFGALFGNEIEYGENGQIKTLKNPFERFRRGFIRRVSG